METNMVTTAGSLLDKGKLFLKAVIIFFMALGLWIPSFFINDVIRERETRQQEAIDEVSSKWAGKQTLTGPLLMIPYTEAEKNSKGIVNFVKRKAWFPADKMEIGSVIVPDIKHRGIYQVTVYSSKITISGSFNEIRWKELNVPAENILWNEASLVFAVSDNIRGINEDVTLNWDTAHIFFNPSAQDEPALRDALSATIPLSVEASALKHPFTIQFNLNGAEEFMVTAAARENKLAMSSSWKDPSFTGIKLPDEKTISDSGFTASWKYMNRTIPMVWKDQFFNLNNASFGTRLITPVDGYDKTARSIKYALLCIILTFAAFFLIESIYKKPLHLIQYGLAGLALVLFYTLLLSISEYLGFNLAYLVAGAATIGLVTWFVGGIMKSSKLGIFIGFVLTVVYAYIFSIIQLQDFALLMGSVGLFIALAIIMFFSRKLQW